MIVNGDEFENIEMIHSNLSKDNPYKLPGYPTHHSPDMNRNTTHANQKCDIIITGSADDHRRAGNAPQCMLSPSSDSDVMLEMVKNKGLIKTAKMDERMSSIDSDMSEASTLVSVASDTSHGSSRRRSKIKHHSIQGFVSATEKTGVCVKKIHTICMQRIWG